MDSSMDRKLALLQEAIGATTGERHLNYGKPEDNFFRIATLWNAWMQIRHDGPLTSFDVAIMMGHIKDARLANTPSHHDSWVDKAGYAACGADITHVEAPPSAQKS